MPSESQPSFSPSRRWSLSLNTAVSLLTVFALVLMANYLAARHFKRWSASSRNQTELSALTHRVLAGVTNEVKITVYFSKREPLYEMTRDLLKSYRLANPRIAVQLVDYEKDPGEAQSVKAKYGLSDKTDRDMVIFESKGGKKFVYESELSELDLQPMMTGQSREVRRTAFKGELMFTSAIRNVVQARQLKAYLVQGHGEHDPESTDKLHGYAQFARVLDDNNIKREKLSLESQGDIPSDCSLLVIAGPLMPLSPEAIEKIDRYLKGGGRLLLLFRFESVPLRPTGLEQLMATWGVAVGRNVVLDEKLTLSGSGKDVVLSSFSGHPLIKPFGQAQIQVFLPRTIAKQSDAAAGPDAPQVDWLAETSPAGRIVREVGARGEIHPGVSDPRGAFPVMVAVEKGGIRNVSADRGATRLVVIGDSYMLGNETIDRGANLQFASQAVNWLLAQNELLADLPPRPIKEFKLTMTRPQMRITQWLLLAAFPGSVLFLGWLVWLKRRR